MRNKTHYLKMNIDKFLLVMKGNKYQEINFYHTKKKLMNIKKFFFIYRNHEIKVMIDSERQKNEFKGE